LFKTFSSKATIESVMRETDGDLSPHASSARLAEVPRSSNKRYPLDPCIQNRIRDLYGPIQTWVPSLKSVTISDNVYRCSNGEFSVGDANIGFMTSGSSPQYRVGRIRKILQIGNDGPNFNADEIKDQIIFLVDRQKDPPRIFQTHLWNHVLSHQCLGLLLASTEVEKEVEVVPLSQIIGHIAVRLLETTFGSIMLTMQLTKVSNIIS
jgi:hypothetical protein